MHVVDKATRISLAKFYCKRLTTVQDSLIFGTPCIQQSIAVSDCCKVLLQRKILQIYVNKHQTAVRRRCDRKSRLNRA